MESNICTTRFPIEVNSKDVSGFLSMVTVIYFEPYETANIQIFLINKIRISHDSNIVYSYTSYRSMPSSEG
jgi:hypothetical protein